MASINDVNTAVNKVNTSVNKVNASVQAEITATNNVKTSVDAVDADIKNLDVDVKTLDGDVKAGFAATVNELKNLEQIEAAAVNLLFHLTQQADTMICALQQISQNTCGILTQVTIQTGLQTRIREDIDAVRDIEGSVHPEAALERHRLAELREQIEKCCPPPVPDPACTYHPCPSPPPVRMPNLPKDPGGVNPPTNPK